MSKNIYWEEKIYQGVEDGESRYNYPSFPVIGDHNFKEAQEVTEGVDYEKEYQMLIYGKWVDCGETNYNSIPVSNTEDRRIVALPLHQSVQQQEVKGVEEKAKELVEKFQRSAILNNHSAKKYYSRELALICVDEILEQLPQFADLTFKLDPAKEFWQSVKNFITNNIK